MNAQVLWGNVCSDGISMYVHATNLLLGVLWLQARHQAIMMYNCHWKKNTSNVKKGNYDVSFSCHGDVSKWKQAHHLKSKCYIKYCISTLGYVPSIQLIHHHNLKYFHIPCINTYVTLLLHVYVTSYCCILFNQLSVLSPGYQIHRTCQKTTLVLPLL